MAKKPEFIYRLFLAEGNSSCRMKSLYGEAKKTI